MNDNVNHPKHYSGVPTVIECIDVCRHLPFNLGNAFKYVWRAGKKGSRDNAVEDLKKALWYLDDYENNRIVLPIMVGANAVFELIPKLITTRYRALNMIRHCDTANAKSAIYEMIKEFER